MSENRCIGKENKIPWHVPNDFKWFKEFTMGNIIIVGKKTFDTLPLLKNRECFILLKKDPVLYENIQNDYLINNNGMAGKVITNEDIESYSFFKRSYLIVAGGAKTYINLLPYITEFYVTHITGSYDGDTFIRPFEHTFNKSEVVREFDGHKVIKYSK